MEIFLNIHHFIWYAKGFFLMFFLIDCWKVDDCWFALALLPLTLPPQLALWQGEEEEWSKDVSPILVLPLSSLGEGEKSPPLALCTFHPSPPWGGKVKSLLFILLIYLTEVFVVNHWKSHLKALPSFIHKCVIDKFVLSPSLSLFILYLYLSFLLSCLYVYTTTPIIPSWWCRCR